MSIWPLPENKHRVTSDWNSPSFSAGRSKTWKKTKLCFCSFFYKTIITSRRGGEESSTRCLTVTVGQLGPVLQCEYPGRDWATFHFTFASRHASFSLADVERVVGNSCQNSGGRGKGDLKFVVSNLRLKSLPTSSLCPNGVRRYVEQPKATMCCLYGPSNRPSSHSWCFCAPLLDTWGSRCGMRMFCC